MFMELKIDATLGGPFFGLTLEKTGSLKVIAHGVAHAAGQIYTQLLV
jgi:hypothetical protein